MKTLSTIKDKVWSKIPKAPDLELHIKTTRAGNLELVNVRDYVPSLKQYGRGVVFPTHLLGRVIEDLQNLQHYLGGSNGQAINPGSEQGGLDL